MWHKEYQSTVAYKQVRLPSMMHTVHLILDLKPDTKYEIKPGCIAMQGLVLSQNHKSSRPVQVSFPNEI